MKYCLPLAILLLLSTPVFAQSPDDGRIQSYSGSIMEDDAFLYFDLFGLQAGQTLYVYLQSDDMDAYVALGDILVEEIFAEQDETLTGVETLEFTIPADGDYSVVIGDCCEFVNADFELVIGINAPEVLTGQAVANTDDLFALFDSSIGGLAPVGCAALQPRPELSGEVMTRETENFVIHYTMQGRDGATPNFVDEVQSIVEDVLAFQIEELGWAFPPADCGEGGDTRFDIYLLETVTDGALGYVTPEGYVDDNPLTEAVETTGGYSYLVIDNNFAGMAAPRPVMRATTAHEFHHVIQMGYDADEPTNWYFEAVATWMETQTFPDSEDATPYVVEIFNTPDLCVGSTPAEDPDSLRIYAEWLLIDSVAQDYGQDAIRRLWEIIIDEDGMDAFYSLLDELGTTPQDTLLRFAVRNLLGEYELASRFDSRVRVEAVASNVGTVEPRQSGVQELGTDYVLMRAPLGTYRVSINSTSLLLYAVGIDQPNRQAVLIELGQEGVIDTSPYTYTYLLVFNPQTHADPWVCTTTDWILDIQDATGETPLDPLPDPFDATQFVPAG